MFARTGRRLSYANVMATVAVFFGLGAAGYAATTLPPNSVGSVQLKGGAVITSKLADQAVSAAKVKRGSLTGAQIDAATLGTVRNARHATDADHLGGLAASRFYRAASIRKVSALEQCNTPAPGCPSKTVLDMGVLRMRATCSTTFGLEVDFDATGPGADVNYFYDQTPSGASTAIGVNGGGLGGTGNLLFNDPQYIHAAGTFIYRDDARVITVPFAVYVAYDPGSGTKTCEIEGTATQATS